MDPVLLALYMPSSSDRMSPSQDPKGSCQNRLWRCVRETKKCFAVETWGWWPSFGVVISLRFVDSHRWLRPRRGRIVKSHVQWVQYYCEPTLLTLEMMVTSAIIKEVFYSRNKQKKGGRRKKKKKEKGSEGAWALSWTQGKEASC